MTSLHKHIVLLQCEVARKRFNFTLFFSPCILEKCHRDTLGKRDNAHSIFMAKIHRIDCYVLFV